MNYLVHLGNWALNKFADLTDKTIMLGLLAKTTIHNGFRAVPLILRIIIQQFRFTAIDAILLLSLIGCFSGFVIFSQLYSSLNDFIGDAILSRLIIVFGFREIGPLLVALLVIGRSGSAITVELGNLTTNKQIELLTASGIDIIHFLVLPRVIAMMISCLVLTFAFSVCCLYGGVIISQMTGYLPIGYTSSLILKFVLPDDIFVLFLKPVIFGFGIAFNACFYGINKVINVNYIPKANTWAIVSSILFCFIVNTILIPVFPPVY